MQYESKETLREKREMDDLAEDPIRLLTKRKKHEKQQKQVDNWLEFLKASQEELGTLEAVIKALGRWIPQGSKDKVKELQLLHSTKQRLCDKIDTKGECLDFPAFNKTMLEFKKKFNRKKAP